MPRFDRTGPEGFGPMTGRGTGYCDSSMESRVFGPPRMGRRARSSRYPRRSMRGNVSGGFFRFRRGGRGRGGRGLGFGDFSNVGL